MLITNKSKGNTFFGMNRIMGISISKQLMNLIIVQSKGVNIKYYRKIKTVICDKKLIILSEFCL